MTAGGYIRVSSTKQRDESDSPASQRQRLKAAGATVFFEDVVSGFRLEQRRKAAQFQLLQQAISQRRITTLITTRLDRIARRDHLVLELAELCEAHGVEFVALSSGRVDTRTASGWLNVKMQLLIAEHFSRQLSENIRTGYQGLHSQGIAARSAASLPFHLQREPGTRHGVIPSPAWADARRVVDQVLSGLWTPPQAARFLYERHGTHGDSKTVVTWLRAPALAGHCAKRDGTILIRDCWPALVSDLELEQLRQLLVRRKRWSAAAAGNRQPHALSGLCRCGACGGTMSYHVAKRGDQQYQYLRCSKITCSRRNMVAGPLERQLHGLLGERMNRLVEGLAERQRLVTPPPEVTEWRRELQAREAIPVEFRQPADQQRIQELQGLIQAALQGPAQLDAIGVLALRSRVLDVVGWFNRPEENRNADLRQLVRGVTVDPERREITDVQWIGG